MNTKPLALLAAGVIGFVFAVVMGQGQKPTVTTQEAKQLLIETARQAEDRELQASISRPPIVVSTDSQWLVICPSGASFVINAQGVASPVYQAGLGLDGSPSLKKMNMRTGLQDQADYRSMLERDWQDATSLNQAQQTPASPIQR